MPGERNYHVLYMLCASNSGVRSTCKLVEDYKTYKFLEQEGTTHPPKQNWNDESARRPAPRPMPAARAPDGTVATHGRRR